jgi:hypothetical protein
MTTIVKPDGTQAFESRLNHLIQTKAFDDIKHTFAPHSERQGIRNQLKQFYKANETCIIHHHEKSWKQLKKDTHGYKLAAPSSNISYTIIPSTSDNHLVLDPKNRILAYKFRVPEALIDNLAQASEQLPANNIEAHQRGHYERVHYALWADSSPDIMMSSEYRKQLPHSEDFIAANSKLFKWLSNQLRMLCPELYNSYTSIDKYLELDQRRLAGAWHGTAVNRQIGSDDELKAHKDWKDAPKGLNCVVPWGDYTGGELTMYSLKLRWELKPGDVLFFGGRVISHGVEDVITGVRNSLDLFTHQSSMKWKKKKDAEAGKGAPEKKDKPGKKNKYVNKGAKRQRVV